ncbi:hypothetical protein WJX74_004939 [Apatococcus lobatus]|uniref:Uncharacterized protein n=1 Tax=Apatococcus lobatus TaxID=904363 RepID=A0AAW1QK64_9CHLO
MGRNKPQKSGKSPSQGQQSAQQPQPLKEADALHQQASRRKGAQALGPYETATAAYRHAVSTSQASGDSQQHLESFFGLADCLQGWAATMDAACQALPDAQLTAAAESSCRTSMASLLAEAVLALHLVIAGGEGELKADACVNLGNASCAWAEVLDPGPEALRLLSQAKQAYQQAASLDPEDASIWSNLGDALVSIGEQLCEAGQVEEGQGCYKEALQAYEHSCSLSDSQQGDDLPGLLHNWGVGLHSFASHTQDAAQALSLWSQATMRLQSAASLDVGDVSPLNAMGDVHCGRAERLLATQPSEAARAFQLALTDGYRRALRVHGQDVNALLGIGEVYLQLGRLAASGADVASAQASFATAISGYEKALEIPQKIGKLQDRCDARYNAACALALGGRPVDAKQLLQQLLAAGLINAVDLKADADLQGLS